MNTITTQTGGGMEGRKPLPLPPGVEEAVKLPLWRACAAALVGYGLSYGQELPGVWVAAWLREGVGTRRFSMACARIRKELEPEGFYLRGREDGALVVVEPLENVKKVRSRNRQSVRLLRRAFILAEATPVSALDEHARRVLEHEKEKAAVRMALMGRRALA